jgi:DNA polymerase epsilon subunit 4
MFIQYLAEQGHNVVKSERKPRRNIQYRDLSQAVHRNDNLEFLADIVPKTVPFKEIKEKKTSSTANNATTSEAAVETGQTTLDGSKVIMNGGVINGLPDHTVSSGSGTGNGAVDADDNDDSTIADPNEQLRMESRGVSVRVSNGSTVASNGHPASDDVEMQ